MEMLPEPESLRLAERLLNFSPTNRPEPLRDTLLFPALPCAVIRPEPLTDALHTATSDANITAPEPLTATFSSSPDMLPSTVMLPEPDCESASSRRAVT